MYDRMQALSKEQMTMIHDASMDLMQNVGVAFSDDEAIEIFKKNGLRVEDKTVFFTEKDIRSSIETAPSRFTITARDREKNVHIGGDDFVLVPGYGSPFMAEIDGTQREATMEDYDNFCKLVQTSKYINMNGFMMVEPSDMSPKTAHLDMIFSNIALCDKPFMGSPTSKEVARDCIEMMGIVWGGKEKLKEMPVTASLITPFSPLRYTEEMTGALIEFARYGQAIVIGTLIMAGASGPVTLAGVMAQQIAELLAGLTLAQLVRQGTPVVIGGGSSIIDMRTGGLSMGAPEFDMITSATSQMIRFYNLPVRSGCALTDAHFPDAQAGAESALGLYTGIRSGGNFILHACGILSSFNAMSYEKFIIDEELCGMIKKIVSPFEVTDESIGLDIIKKVGIGGQYLTHPKTLELCRTGFFLCDLMCRSEYNEWREDGGKRIDEKASEILTKRLTAYEKPDIDPDIEKDLAGYVAERKR